LAFLLVFDEMVDLLKSTGVWAGKGHVLPAKEAGAE